MKTKTLLSSIAASILFSGFAIAGPVNYQSNVPSSSALFGPETNVGGYAMYVKPDFAGASDKWGGGLVGEHFFSSYFGVAGSAAWVDMDEAGTWHNYIGDAIIRIPIESLRFAPYALAGAGMIYGDDEWNLVGRFGAGIDVRITKGFGIFGDWIYYIPDGSTGLAGENYATTRIGVKISF